MATSNGAVQVIDEEKEFQQQSITEYVKKVIHHDLGLNYHVISVFGSQSTGKSTLLNNLFHTQFDVMNETQRQQTTKGIWLGYTEKVASSTEDNASQSILVMDVEGSDGRERGEDQDFERKAALFALATSEVLIVNIWEHQVGLYQGANMGLLKTVFEVNLSLFGNQKHKVLLLFVIRDHIGTTPLSNLSNTLTQDLQKMWDSIAKPNTVPSTVQMSDYFDLQFTTLSHKVLQPEEFYKDIKKLGDKVVDPQNEEYIFKPNYHQNFPIDGWTLYAKNCWEQIQSNKDLDLPTQQILVARFRCDEIAKESLIAFEESYALKFKDVKVDTLKGDQLALAFKELHDGSLDIFDSQASHYNKSVYETRRKALSNDIVTKLSSVYQAFLKELIKSSLLDFKSKINDKSNKSSFLDKSSTAKDEVLSSFTKNLSPLQKFNELFSYDLTLFESDLNLELESLRAAEVDNVINRSNKSFVPKFKNRSFEIFSTPDDTLWDRILSNLKDSLNESLVKYKTEDGYDFKVGGDNEKILAKITRQAWISADDFIHDYLREDNVVNILRREFEDVFTYDSDNIPRVWKNELEISQAYKTATEYALKSLPLFSIAKLSNGTEILPDYQEDLENDDDDDDDNHGHRFAHILTAPQQLKIKQQFLKIAEISYRDANRSIITNIAKIPPFVYILLIILGWNEFMAILRNPLYLVLAILLGTGVFFIHTLNLWGPVQATGNILLQQGKEWLASSLLDAPPQRRRVEPIGVRTSEFNEKTEDIELDDLSEKRE